MDEEALKDCSEINLDNIIYPGYGNTKFLIIQILCCCYLNYDIDKQAFLYSVSEKEIQKFCTQSIDSIFRFTNNFSINNYKKNSEKCKSEFYERLFCFLCYLVISNTENVQLNKAQINKIFDYIKKSWSVIKLKGKNKTQNDKESSLDLFITNFNEDYIFNFHSLEILRKISFRFLDLTEIKKLKQSYLIDLPINSFQNINGLLKENNQNNNDHDSISLKQEELVGVTSFEHFLEMLKLMNRLNVITRKESKICIDRNILLTIEMNKNIGMEMFYQILNKNPSIMKMKFSSDDSIKKALIDNEGFDDDGFDDDGFECDNSKVQSKIKPRNVLDYLISIYYISEHAVREILATNLDICKLSIPFVLPKGEILL